MPSRKRIKGKQRKALQQAAAVSPTTNLAADPPRPATALSLATFNNANSGSCMHGLDLSTPIPPEVERMLTELDRQLNDIYETPKLGFLLYSWDSLFTSHYDALFVRSDNGFVHGREITLRILIHKGMEAILSPATLTNNIASWLSFLIEVFEGRKQAKSLTDQFVIYAAFNALQYFNSDRDLLRFYKDRASCNCLKGMYKEAKKMPSVDACHFCTKTYEVSKLFRCSACTIGQYCSQQCQKKDWTKHKVCCEFFHKSTFIRPSLSSS